MSSEACMQLPLLCIVVSGCIAGQSGTAAAAAVQDKDDHQSQTPRTVTLSRTHTCGSVFASASHVAELYRMEAPICMQHRQADQLLPDMTSCRCSSSAPAPAAPASTHTLGLLLVWVVMLQKNTTGQVICVFTGLYGSCELGLVIRAGSAGGVTAAGKARVGSSKTQAASRASHLTLSTPTRCSCSTCAAWLHVEANPFDIWMLPSCDSTDLTCAGSHCNADISNMWH
jgi:hypothetical protein